VYGLSYLNRKERVVLIALFILWIVFNGRIAADVLVSGVILSAALFLFSCRFCGHSIYKEKILYKEIPYILMYLLLLVVEIIKSTDGVLIFVRNRKLNPDPKLIRFRPPLKTRIARVLLANSITLTPGTITASLEGEEFVVHCLDSAMGKGIESSRFVKLLERMEEVAGV